MFDFRYIFKNLNSSETFEYLVLDYKLINCEGYEVITKIL